MTNTIIDQRGQEIKSENKCITELTKNKCIVQLNGGRMEHYIAKEILLGSNELAADILAINGFSQYESDGFAKGEVVRDYYGVKETYFSGILRRFYISAAGTPEDVHREKYSGKITISPRMVLALSAIMFCGRNIPADSMVAKVYNNLKGTRYYAKAKKEVDIINAKQMKYEKQSQAAHALAKTAFQDDSEIVEITSSGKVLISVENLARLVQYLIPSMEPIEDPVKKTVLQNAKKPDGRSAGAKRVKASRNGEEMVFESVKACAMFIGVASSTVSAVIGKSGRHVKGWTVVPA